MPSLTLDDLIADLQDAKAIAKEKGNSNALVTATMAQAKLLGFDKPKPYDPNQEAIDLISQLMDELSQ